MSTVLEIQDLKKSFGSHQVINNMHLAVPEHSVFGFIGSNGSGKTTTMKMILGLLKADGGTISVCGEQVSYGETRTNRYIGYLPDVPEYYGYMKPMEYLHLCGAITGMSRSDSIKRSLELLQLVGLSNVNRRIAGFSRGMKQRLGIAQALLNQPRLLLCDEPTSALDPLGRKEILDILSSVRGKTTVLFSTHVLSDVERICDRIAVLDKGKIALFGSLSDIKDHHSHNEYSIEFTDERSLEIFMQALAKDASVTNGKHKLKMSNEGRVLSVSLPHTEQGLILVNMLSALQITPVRFEEREPNLEDLFMEVIA